MPFAAGMPDKPGTSRIRSAATRPIFFRAEFVSRVFRGFARAIFTQAPAEG
jgi:hypothetical protein